MKPTHVLKVLDKRTDHKAAIGVAWVNNKGEKNENFTLSINPCVVIQANDDFVYTLFPIDTNGHTN